MKGNNTGETRENNEKRRHWSSDVEKEITARGVINVVVNETSQHLNTFDVSYRTCASI